MNDLAGNKMQINDFMKVIEKGHSRRYIPAKKRGIIGVRLAEATPLVWNGRLYRFEWYRLPLIARLHSYYEESMGEMCFRFVDFETGDYSKSFAYGYTFGSAYEENGTLYALGTLGGRIDIFVSGDMESWEQRTIIDLPGTELYNTSLCKCPEGYILAFETGPYPFTINFACSADIIHWDIMPMDEYAWGKDFYAACPTIRWYDGWYYLLYGEELPRYRYAMYIARTKDFKTMELGIQNPIFYATDEDRYIEHPEKFTQKELELLELTTDVGDLDFDLCEFNGKTIITYTWGNQMGDEFLNWAEYDGPMGEFLKSHF